MIYKLNIFSSKTKAVKSKVVQKGHLEKLVKFGNYLW